MSRIQVHLTTIILVILCVWSQTVRADPATDLLRGNGLYLAEFQFDLNGPFVAGNLSLSKYPGALDTSISARTLGLDLDTTLYLRGSLSGQTLTWTFSSTFSPTLDLGYGYALTQVDGALVGDLTFIDGSASPACSGNPCPYNVRIRSNSSSWLRTRVSGPFWTTSESFATNIRFDVYGGLPRPVLSGFRIHTPTRGALCERMVVRRVLGQVGLAAVAPTGGAWVNITSSDPDHVRIVGVPIPAGQNSATFSFSIAPGWSGSALLTASSGGTERTLTVTVRPEAECLELRVPYLVRTKVLGDCLACSVIRHFNSADQVIGLYNGRGVLYQPDKGLQDLGNLFGGGNVDPWRISTAGSMVGAWTTTDGYYYGFARHGLNGTVQKLVNTYPLAINDQEAFVGIRWSDAQQKWTAFAHNGRSIFDLPVPGYWSEAIGVNLESQVAGTLADDYGVRPYLFTGGQILDLGDLGGGYAAATSLSEAGDVAGYSLTSKGDWHPFLAPAGWGDLIDVGTLPGYDMGWANAINSAGIVAGTSSTWDGSYRHGFLYSLELGMIDLNELLDSATDAEVFDAIAINDNNDVLVSGFVNGAWGYFVLTLQK